MIYQKAIPVEFNHCDPAGIVFYPRYFEMCNSVVENFFADAIGLSFAEIHKEAGSGVPAVSIAADFQAPSRLGDKLSFALTVEKIGASSAALQIVGTCDGEKRLTLRLTIVWIRKGKASAWPEGIRKKLEGFI